jgi:hypothetical protein
MPNDGAAKLIADNLAALTHPGNGKPVVLPLPMFRSSGIPADQAEQFAKEAGLPHADINVLVAEAIVELLEKNGMPPTPKAQIDQLQVAAAANETQRNREVQLHCTTCRTPLFTILVRDFDGDKPLITPQVIAAVKQLSAECALGHQVQA